MEGNPGRDEEKTEEVPAVEVHGIGISVKRCRDGEDDKERKQGEIGEASVAVPTLTATEDNEGRNGDNGKGSRGISGNVKVDPFRGPVGLVNGASEHEITFEDDSDCSSSESEGSMVDSSASSYSSLQEMLCPVSTGSSHSGNLNMSSRSLQRSSHHSTQVFTIHESDEAEETESDDESEEIDFRRTREEDFGDSLSLIDMMDEDSYLEFTDERRDEQMTPPPPFGRTTTPPPSSSARLATRTTTSNSPSPPPQRPSLTKEEKDNNHLVSSDSTKDTRETKVTFDANLDFGDDEHHVSHRRLFGVHGKKLMDNSGRAIVDATKEIQEKFQEKVDQVVEKVDAEANQSDEANKKERAFALFLGLVLTFNMGFVNGACFSGWVVAGKKEPVAAFTNPYTDAALQLAYGNYERVRFQAIMIFAFIGGSFISGLVTPNAVPYRIEPTYGPSFLAAGICLCFSSFFATTENYGNVAFYLAAAAGGIQNGIASAYTAKLIRSTGLTGSSTDIGLYLGQYVRGNKENRTKLLVLIMLAISFTTGGFLSFYITQVMTSYALLISAVLFLFIGMSIMVFLVQKLSISFRAAMFGTWKWQAAAESIRTAFGDTFGEAFELDGSGKGGTMTDREIDLMFDRIDVDGSGTIDAEELYILLRSTGAQVSREESDMMLQYADRDGDGVLNREEWKFVVETALSGRKTMIEMTKNVVGSSAEAARNVAASTRHLMGSGVTKIRTSMESTTDMLGSSARNLFATTKKVGSFRERRRRSTMDGSFPKQKRKSKRKKKKPKSDEDDDPTRGGDEDSGLDENSTDMMGEDSKGCPEQTDGEDDEVHSDKEKAATRSKHKEDKTNPGSDESPVRSRNEKATTKGRGKEDNRDPGSEETLTYSNQQEERTGVGDIKRNPDSIYSNKHED